MSGVGVFRIHHHDMLIYFDRSSAPRSFLCRRSDNRTTHKTREGRPKGDSDALMSRAISSTRLLYLAGLESLLNFAYFQLSHKIPCQQAFLGSSPQQQKRYFFYIQKFRTRFYSRGCINYQAPNGLMWPFISAACSAWYRKPG